jgi:5-hydroxyisourate hydrolase-like protein (transthyretin family)
MVLGGVGLALAGCGGGREVAPQPATAARSAVQVREPRRTEGAREPEQLRGRLVDPFGEPVAGGRLQLIGGPEPGPAVEAGVDGRFALPRPQTAPEQALLVTHPRLLPRIVELGPTADAGDLTLTSALGCTVEVLRSGSGEPVAEARVRLEPVLFDPRLGGPDPLARTAATRTDGRAEIYALAAGTWRLTVTAPGLASAEDLHVQPGGESGPPRIRIALEPGHPLRGTLVDPDGRALAHARIEVRDPRTGRTLGRTRSADDGSFRLADLPAGGIELRGLREPDLLAPWTAVEVPAAQLLRLATRNVPALIGRVVDAGDGRPIAGARLAARRRRTEAGEAPTLRMARTDTEGRFELDGVFLGSWDIDATSEAHVPQQIGRLELPLSRPLEIQLSPAAEVRGTVLEPSGRPLPGAEIDWMPAAYDGSALQSALRGRAWPPGRRAGPDGAFRLAVPAVAGRLLVRAPGLAPLLTGILEPGGPARTLRLERGTVIRGRARRADGAPAAGVLVGAEPVRSADDPSVRLAASARSAADGSFVLGPLSAGPYDLFYHSMDRSRGARQVADEIEATRIRLTVGASGALACELVPR